MSETITHRQLATILAALHHWQHSGMTEANVASPHLSDVASDYGSFKALDAQELHALYQILSTLNFRAESYRPKVCVVHDAGEIRVLSDPEVEVERIATTDVVALFDENPAELFEVLGETFKHLDPTAQNEFPVNQQRRQELLP